MTIQTSKDYKTDVKARRLFGAIHEQLSALTTQIEGLLTLGNSMRGTVGQAALSLAQIEALYVDQTHDKRNVDALLYTAQTQLADMAAKVNYEIEETKTVIVGNAKTVAGLLTQSDRIVGDRYVKDTEPGAPIPGVDYVDLNYFAEKLNFTPTHIRRLIERSQLPSHDAVSSADSDRPKFLYLKWRADTAISQWKSSRKVDKVV